MFILFSLVFKFVHFFSCIHHFFNFDMFFLNVGSNRVHCWLNIHFHRNLL